MREEEKKRSSQSTGIKRFFKKRWTIPALYIASAAIILTAVLWYQNGSDVAEEEPYDQSATDLSGRQTDEQAVEVTRSEENFAMPVTDEDAVEIKKQFYDSAKTTEEQEAALVFFNNSYQPNTGIDIARKDGETFDVTAALSGTVKEVEEDALLGNVVKVEHDKGIETVYQALQDIEVSVGDKVKKGQTLAKAGNSQLNEDAGIHVHFEIRKDDVPVNPLDYIKKPLSDLQKETTETTETNDTTETTETNKTNETP
ncbi:M23 family metallopeptidase [Bacillaceae bacterium Marseille-Q3522]|nr:M23 family metallopeptidase [Bacillaceae bacterium Marseille-Q3522]